jgi:hypothetical protein
VTDIARRRYSSGPEASSTAELICFKEGGRRRFWPNSSSEIRTHAFTSCPLRHVALGQIASFLAQFAIRIKKELYGSFECLP